jgi:UDP-N-acetylmuramate: L-alanyl-gamma-D-glutamyl-meso-diaminopimelate ligase
VVAAVAIARGLGASADDIRRGVARFAGVKRRQEVLGMAQGVFVMDDYAHHPTAVAETLKGLRKRFDRRRIIAVYEPRTATSRRRTFQSEFVEAFLHADMLIVGRLFDPSHIPEEERFDAARLALDVHQGGIKATCIQKVEDIVAMIVDEVRPGDVVVIMSSGAFDGLHGKLISALGDAVMPAAPTDLPLLREMLDSVGLENDEVPLDQPEIGGENNAVFLVLRNETGLVGCVCLEVYAEDAILRSLVVVEEARGAGYGWMLADAAIQLARHRGVRRVYLLTETASDFFAEKHGFRVVVPSTIAVDVAESATFRGCAEGAVAMRLDL